MWQNIILEAKQLLGALGIPFVESPAFAESQCAYLVKQRVAQYSNLDQKRRLKTKNILIVRDALISQGYNPHFIADASAQGRMDDKGQYEKLINNKVINITPSRRTADIFILKHARKWEC